MALRLKDLYRDLITALDVDGLEIPTTAVSFFKNDDAVPECVWDYYSTDISITSCQATRQSSLGDAVCLTRDNIGCIAAAITFGLVDQNENTPLGDSRVYTDIMKKQSSLGMHFNPPTPRDFTEGIVYACRDSGRNDFCLFGSNDAGRFKTKEIAKKAIQGMAAIQPPIMKAVFFYTPDWDEAELQPDVIVMSVRPVELARFVQAFQFSAGERIEASMGAVRAVNSDLIVRPYLSKKINVSTYCVGARLIAGFGPDRMGIGIPFPLFVDLVHSIEESQTGYPFHLYPGAAE